VSFLSSTLASLLSFATLAQTIRIAIPYASAALAGVTSERSGVVNIALEGMLLIGGLAGIVAHIASGSAIFGVFSGVAAGAMLGLAHGLFVVKGRVNAIVSGLALNLVAVGGTRFTLRALYDSSSNSPSVSGFRIASLSGASGGLLLVRTLLDPFLVATLALAAALAFVLTRTRFGLRLRACGEDPVAAASVGVPVARVRLVAVTASGALAGLGGVALAYDQHQFQAGMSGGRGFIALAAVILAGWRPMFAVAACFAFAALDAMQIVLQDQPWIPASLVQMLPYVATLVALFVIARRSSRGEVGRMKPPRGLGKHED
jgi:general nucleoside transport system permease protein